MSIRWFISMYFAGLYLLRAIILINFLELTTDLDSAAHFSSIFREFQSNKTTIYTIPSPHVNPFVPVTGFIVRALQGNIIFLRPFSANIPLECGGLLVQLNEFSVYLTPSKTVLYKILLKLL